MPIQTNVPQKKVDQAITFIEQYIADNCLKEGSPLPTENQLSERLRLSRVTIRRALAQLREGGLVYSVHGSGHYVASPYRESPSEAHEPHTVIPMIVSNNDSSFRSMEILQGAEDYCSAHGNSLVIHITNNNDKKERELVLSHCQNGTKCMIILPHYGNENAEMYCDLIRQGIQLVFVDKKPDISCHYVCSDNFAGGYMATEHLISLGNTRIAFFAGESPHQASSVEQRLNGYFFALRKHGLPIKQEYQVFYDPQSTDSADRLDELLNLSDAPTAIFALNDGDALFALNHLHRRQIRVPEDVALIGFDNIAMASHCYPPLSTIDQPFYMLGYHAARLACHLAKIPQDSITNLFLPVSLISRESTTGEIL